MAKIPQRASARVIVDNDFAGDPDSLIALAHQLLTPKTRCVLVTSSALYNKRAIGTQPGTSAIAGRDVAQELIRRAGLTRPPLVIAGSNVLGAQKPEISDAARAIVAEAMRDDPLPLIVTCGGPLTNVGAALALEPRIASRITLIWIGGGAYPAGGWEYNLAADLPAARAVLERPELKLWQVPQPAYRQMAFPISAMTDRLLPMSPLGAWLYERFTHPPDFIELGGSWPLGDSPTVLLSAVTTESSQSVDLPARRINDDCTYGAEIPGTQVRVFTTLDARLAFEDFFALMHLQAEGQL